MSRPPLRRLHGPSSLVVSKLERLRRLPTEALLASLEPGTPGALRTRGDGTVMNGNHRIAILEERDVDVDALPREELHDAEERSSEHEE